MYRPNLSIPSRKKKLVLMFATVFFPRGSANLYPVFGYRMHHNEY
jgi:hypothetical protein